MAVSGKRWTDEETEYLKENWGKLTYKEIAAKLGKDVKSVQTRASYIGLGASYDAADMLTLNTVYNALYGYNPSQQCVARLLEKGFPIYIRTFRSKRFRLVNPDRMWEWLREHQDEFDFVRFEEYSLGAEPDWVRDKRKADWQKYNNWRWGITN